LIPPRCYCTLW